MTTNKKSSSAASSRRKRSHRASQSGSWPLQDAKARFSELVRQVKSDGPQLVTVHGREEVVVISAQAFRKLAGHRTGKALVELMRCSPLSDVDIEPARIGLPVRDVTL